MPPYADNPSNTAAMAGDAPAYSEALRGPARRVSRVLIAALLISLAVHLALTLWPIESETVREDAPLQATITELPPPPEPEEIAVLKKPTAKLKRATPKPSPKPEVKPEQAPAQEPTVANVAEEATAMGPPAPPASPERSPYGVASGGPQSSGTEGEAAKAQPPTPAVAAAEPVGPVAPESPQIELPPRVDLAYKVFLGTQGFMIGDATYRFEHSGNEYRIVTIGQARGLAALLVRGQGKVESRGLITRFGLQPQEFAIERGSPNKREVARFDWETGVVILHEQKTEPLDPQTFDPMALMWQFYFSPPTSDEMSFSVATTRRVLRYTINREGTETINWANGEILTERWHRKSDDGKTDSYAWLAPSLHYVPVKLRIVATHRGTLEALLDSIRIDDNEIPSATPPASAALPSASPPPLPPPEPLPLR